MVTVVWGTIDMNRHFATWLLLAAGMALTACETGQLLLEKNAQGDELRKETTIGVTLPAGCPTVTVSLPAGQNGLTVTYREPSTNGTGSPLTNLLYTTIYIGMPNGQTQAIRIWTNDPRGGATVTIRNVVPPAPEVRLCVTATNWARQESPPAPPIPPKP